MLFCASKGKQPERYKTGKEKKNDLLKTTELGVRIRKIRECRGISQLALAESLGVTQPQVSYLEGGKRGISWTFLNRLARALDVETSALITDEEPDFLSIRSLTVNTFEIAAISGALRSIDTEYRSLMDGLEDAVMELDEMPAALADAKMNVKATKDELISSEVAIIIKHGGWPRLGKNETERKHALRSLTDKDDAYQAIARELWETEREVLFLTETMDNMRRKLSAISSATRLHSSYILAVSAVRVEIATNDVATAADGIDELGL